MSRIKRNNQLCSKLGLLNADYETSRIYDYSHEERFCIFKFHLKK